MTAGPVRLPRWLRPTGRLLLVVTLAAPVLASCMGLGIGGSTGANVPTNVPRVVGAQTSNQREHARILAAYGGAYSNPALQAALDGMARTLAAASDKPDATYRITMLNSPGINAFALPNGDLYVTRGLLALANDSSEAAAVIAHEMGHVSARHAFERADRERQAVLVSRVVSDVLGDSEAGALSLARSRLALARFSRFQELEADRIGIRTLQRAGYDPHGASRFLRSMGRASDFRSRSIGSPSESEAVDFLSSHPSTPERVHLAAQAARDTGAEPKPGIDRDVFLEALEGTVFGDDPREGLVRGRRFIHPVKGFTFLAPDGFSMENSSGVLVGVGAGGTAFRMDSEPAGMMASPEAMLESGVIEDIKVVGIERRNINGNAAALGVARGQDWTFRVAVIRLDDRMYRFVFAARDLTPELDATFRAAIDSFRRMSSGEIASAKPLRIRLAKVRSGDTVQSMAARMPGVSNAVEQFLILNGLERGAQLRPGQTVKIVTE